MRRTLLICLRCPNSAYPTHQSAWPNSASRQTISPQTLCLTRSWGCFYYRTAGFKSSFFFPRHCIGEQFGCDGHRLPKDCGEYGNAKSPVDGSANRDGHALAMPKSERFGNRLASLVKYLQQCRTRTNPSSARSVAKVFLPPGGEESIVNIVDHNCGKRQGYPPHPRPLPR